MIYVDLEAVLIIVGRVTAYKKALKQQTERWNRVTEKFSCVTRVPSIVKH
jgi:hypothetical protein